MYMYNLGVHCFNTDEGFMYVWDESNGGRGSQEIATVVKKHLKDNTFNHKHILYSYSCCGQNRNIKMLLTFLKLVHDPDISANIIGHKFMVSGHSFLPNYSEF